MAKTTRVLGLDLGANSIGWALIEEESGAPKRIVDVGVRIFSQTVDGSIEEGKDEPLGAQRREARQRRRQLDRRSMRRVKTMRCLQKHGLFPEGETATGKERQALVNQLDHDLMKEFQQNGNTIADLTQFPYFLRARGLDHELTPHAFGRAIYHLCQRRGFKSNRKDGGKKDEDAGQVKGDIIKLAKLMAEAKVRTLGEYFNSIDPHEQRIRKRWTGRQMFEYEFGLLWKAQERFNPALYNEKLRKALFDCLFAQRDLKSQKGLVGKCELEPKKRRAAWATLPAQEFRYLQKINDLHIKYDDGSTADLTQEQRDLLREAAAGSDALDKHGLLTFAKVRSLLGLKKGGSTFNLEEGGEKSIHANKTAHRIRAAIGDKWDALSPERQRDLVGELLGVTNEATMKDRARRVWGCTDEEADLLTHVRLEESYCSYSTRALNNLLPGLREGKSFATVKLEIYGPDNPWTGNVLNELLPLESPIDPHTGEVMENSTFKILSIRNPVVHRVLSQVRVVVNHLIREHGVPDKIRLEMARDLKRPKKQRQDMAKRNRDLEKERKRVASQLASRFNIQNPSRNDITKYLLWEECNGVCPYTGNQIAVHALFGDAPQYDIEHIIPFSRSLDDSFVNKTLCYHEENRHVKRNQTPYETYAGNETQWEQILGRVRDFKGDRVKPKLERFLMENLDSLDTFTTRHLNDTRYASKEAKKYLGMLYGDDANKCIQTSTGQLTAFLRNGWKLNGILNDGDTKSRDDHRHHAVDAVVVALITPAMVKRMADAAQQQLQEKGRTRGWWNHLKDPWDGFLSDCQTAVEGINVSHMLNRKVRGQLHDETNYSPQRTDEETGKKYVHIRKKLDKDFKAAQVENIIDPAVRSAVRNHLNKHNSDAKAAFTDPANHPAINGIPIHRVRIRKNSTVTPVGPEGYERHVELGNNHHVEVIEYKDKKGNTKWEFVVVDLFETVRRKKQKQPIIQRDHGPDKEFIFSLCKGDTVLMKNIANVEELFVLRSIKQEGKLIFKRHTDARLSKEIDKEEGLSRRKSSFQNSNPRKVVVSPLGRIYTVGRD